MGLKKFRGILSDGEIELNITMIVHENIKDVKKKIPLMERGWGNIAPERPFSRNTKRIFRKESAYISR